MTTRMTVEERRAERRALKARVGWLVDRLHVSTPDSEVEADIRARCERAGMTKSATTFAVKAALERHHRNQHFFITVNLGNLR